MQQAQRVGLALVAMMALGLPHALGAALNFTLVDTTSAGSPRIVQEQILGFHMAMVDAQGHLDGLFPDHDVQLIDRTVVDASPNNLQLTQQVVASVEEDDAVAVFGGMQTAAAFLVHNILDPEGMPQASMSLVKHLPITTAQRNFGATTDVLARCKALARLMLDNGLNTITLVHTPTDTFTILALFFEQELPALGVRVEQRLRLEAGGSADVADEILASRNRAVFALTTPPDLQALLLAAEARNLTQSDCAWFYSHDAVLQSFVTTRHNAFPDLTRLVAATKMLAFSLPDLNTSLPAVQAFQERAQQMPAVPSVTGYNVTTDGLTSVFAAAYDSGMAMLRAVNRTLARNVSAWDREAIIDEMKTSDYEGISGHLQYTDGYGGLLHVTVFKQYSDPVTGSGATVTSVAEYNSRTDEVAYAAVEWNTDDGLPPPNFSPESCGVLFARTAEGFCVPCGAGMRNDPTDGAEECAFCDDGTELQGEVCVACGDDEDGVRLESGEPVCEPKSQPGTDWGMVAGIVVGSVVGTALLMAVAVVVYRRVERARTELAEHRAKAKQAQFLAFSFHEMRNPLNVVSSALEFATDTIKKLAKQGNKDVDPVLKDLQCGQQSLVDTVHVLDTINMLSQVIHGVVAAEMQPTCPKELAKEVLAVAREVSMLVNEGEDNADNNEQEDNGEEKKKEDEKGQKGKCHGSRADAGSDQEGDEEGKWEGESDSGIRLEGKGEGGKPRDVELETVVLLDNAPLKSRELFVAMDRQKMRQVLLILLINALKYTTKGKITVRIHLKRRSFVHNHPAPHGDNAPGDPVVVHMSVVDTGSGMPAKDIEHIFDLDYQTERGSVRSTGLGLVLAHRIVGMHGGELKVRSVHAGNAPAQGMETGTRFWWNVQTHLIASTPKATHWGQAVPAVLHPESNSAKRPDGGGTELDDLSQRGKQQASIARPQAAIALFGKERKPSLANTAASSQGNIVDLLRTMPTNLRVLLMEDVKLNRAFMRRKLSTYPFSELGWVVEEVETGEQCLELIVDKGAQFDAVFCDQILSNAGGNLLGNEVAKQLRDHERVTNAEKRMVLIACSGNASDEDRKMYMESGMDGVVAKPLPPQIALFKFLHPLFVQEV